MRSTRHSSPRAEHLLLLRGSRCVRRSDDVAAVALQLYRRPDRQAARSTLLAERRCRRQLLPRLPRRFC